MTENPNPEPTAPTAPTGPAANVGSDGPAYASAPNPYGGPPSPAYGYPRQHGGQQPSQTDLNWAGAAHWGSLVAAWFAMGFIAPLVVMLTVGDQSPFVRRHAVESLNFQISLIIYGAVAGVFSLLTLGLGLIIVIPLLLVAFVMVIVLCIQASVKAMNGEEYRYPLTIRLVR